MDYGDDMGIKSEGTRECTGEVDIGGELDCGAPGSGDTGNL